MNDLYFAIANMNIRLVLPDIYLSISGLPAETPLPNAVTVRVCDSEVSHKAGTSGWVPYGIDGSYGFNEAGDVICRLPDNFGAMPSTFTTLLGLLPIRELLASNGSVFLHSSHVSIEAHDGRRGLIFSAASRTGKSTQARLWCAEHGCEQVGEDRTVITRTPSGFIASAYIGDSKLCERRDIVEPVGAIIILGQGGNMIARLSAEGAFMRLTFLVSAFGDPKTESKKNSILKDLCLSVPVYYYACRPDTNAVAILFDRLTDDGVI